MPTTRRRDKPCPKTSTSSWSSASWPASATRSTRWKRPSRPGRRLPGPDRAPARRLDAGPRVPAVAGPAGPVARVEIAATAATTSIAAKGAPEADRRPVPPRRRADAPSWPAQVAAMAAGPARARRGQGPTSASTRPARRAARFPVRVRRPAWAWPTPCGPPCPRPSRNATAPASASS